MKERKKRGFILHEPLLVHIEILTDEELVRLIRAMVLYHNEGIEEIKEEERLLYSLFYVWKKQYHKDKDDYDKTCQKNRENAMKGGAPKGNQNARKQPKTTENNQKQPKTTETTENNIDIDIDIDTPKVVSNNNKTFLTEGSLHNDVDATRPKTFREKVVSFFNERMQGKSIKAIRSINEGTQRADWLRARRKEYGDEAIFEMIEKASMSSFLNGHNKRGFVATFDWIIRPNNFPKVLEGNYDDARVNESTIEQTEWQS